MDFFEHQEKARRNTKRLVVYFAAGVALLIVTICPARPSREVTLEISQPQGGWVRGEMISSRMGRGNVSTVPASFQDENGLIADFQPPCGWLISDALSELTKI